MGEGEKEREGRGGMKLLSTSRKPLELLLRFVSGRLMPEISLNKCFNLGMKTASLMAQVSRTSFVPFHMPTS